MKYNSPIEVLWGNIVETFENIDPTQLENHIFNVSTGLINPKIDYDHDRSGIQTPRADPESKSIYLNEVHLEYLWSFIYSIFVIYEEGVQRPLLKGNFNGEIKFESNLIIRAKQLYDWAISLSETVSDWNLDLPNPKKHNSDEEKWYVEKVNTLFQNAVAYLMFHEYAHLTLGHTAFYAGKTKKDFDYLTESEQAIYIQLENEADLFALNRVVKKNKDDVDILITGLPILLSICSSLLIINNPEQVKQYKHPDLDIRLANLMVELNLATEGNKFYIYYLAYFSLIFFFKKHNLQFTPSTQDTAQDAFNQAFDFIYNQLKANI